jgi:hypothetical protein
VQFHPEIEESILRRWTSDDTSALDAEGIVVDDLMAATRLHVDANAVRAETLFFSFCRDVVGR